MAQKDENVGSDITKYSIQTETNTEVIQIKSTVKNVSKLPCDKKIIGPDFYLTHECKFCVSFKKDEGDLYVYIRNKSAAEIGIMATLVLYDCNSKKLHDDKRNMSFEKEEERIFYRRVKNRDGFDTLTNDTLFIDIRVTIEKIERQKVNRLMCDIDPEKKLRKDLKAMLENLVNSDVCLQVGKERIHAHWAVLCSRSPYFKRMFESEMRERMQNSVTVTDISGTILKNLIEFLYTASFLENDKDCQMEELFDLYYAADKYEVMDLRTLCASKIMNNASADNVWQIFQLAHRHSDKDLKMEAMSFIQMHSDVFLTDGWKKFEVCEPLAAEVFSFSFKKN